jgi:hypothetical protein
MPNNPNLARPTNKQLSDVTRGRPFRKCCSCGNAAVHSGAEYCHECIRVLHVGMTESLRQFGAPKTEQPSQSYDAFNHKGYSDRIPSGRKGRQ